ncbi:MAG TPA: hypothetical protein VIF62_22795 [Labilithrix sp.]
MGRAICERQTGHIEIDERLAAAPRPHDARNQNGRNANPRSGIEQAIIVTIAQIHMAVTTRPVACGATGSTVALHVGQMQFSMPATLHGTRRATDGR